MIRQCIFLTYLFIGHFYVCFGYDFLYGGQTGHEEESRLWHLTCCVQKADYYYYYYIEPSN